MKGKPFQIPVLGSKFGRLTIIQITSKLPNGSLRVICRCDCGTIKTLRTHSVLTGATKSCGCFNREVAVQRGKDSKKHGLTRSKEYRVWTSMKTRCNNPLAGNYFRYGAKGIKVCESWENSFEQFLKDMGSAPSVFHSIDRENSDLGYSKNNCRWATQAEQNRNKSNNHFVTFNGKTMCLMDWAHSVGCSFHVLSQRLRNGWNIERTLTEPVHYKNALRT